MYLTVWVGWGGWWFTAFWIVSLNLLFFFLKKFRGRGEEGGGGLLALQTPQTLPTPTLPFQTHNQSDSRSCL